jgi:hypothetical protein
MPRTQPKVQPHQSSSRFKTPWAHNSHLEVQVASAYPQVLEINHPE